MPIVTSGNINVTSLIVPDDYIQIVPPSQVTLNGVPSNQAAFVGTAQWGPVNTPIAGSQFSDFLLNFGQLQNRKYDMGTHVYVATQQGMNNFQCVRVTDGTDTAATLVVGSTAITFSGKWTGSFGNTVSVTFQNGSKANTFRVIVLQPGFVAEVFDNIGYTNSVVSTATTAIVTSSTTIPVTSATGIVVGDVISGTGVTGNPTVASISGLNVTASATQSITSGTTLTFTPPGSQIWANMANAVNQGTNAGRPASSWVTAVAGSAVTAPTLNTTYYLSGGTDGVTTITSSVLVGTNPGVGMYALPFGFALLDLCDADASSSWTIIDSFANGQSAYAIQVVPNNTSVTGAISAKQTAGLDSYNSKLLHGDWLYWADPVNQINRLVSPQAFAIGRLSNLSPQLSGLNKKLAGIVGSNTAGITTSAISPYAQANLNLLVSNGIEVITNPGGGNLAIWTMRFGHNTSSNGSIHGDNYTTLTNYIAKTLNAGMGAFLGRTANAQLFNDITATLSQYCATLQGNGLIGHSDGSQSFAVVCNTSNNPTYQLQAGLVTASVQVSFLGIVEVLLVNLQDGTELSTSITTISNSQ